MFFVLKDIRGKRQRGKRHVFVLNVINLLNQKRQTVIFKNEAAQAIYIKTTNNFRFQGHVAFYQQRDLSNKIMFMIHKIFALNSYEDLNLFFPSFFCSFLARVNL